MAREFPPGTIRHWESGDVIKVCGAIPPYPPLWVSLKTNAKFDEIGREADRVAASFIRIKLPINGEKVLDHEIDEFGTSELGSEFFKADKFKVYEGAEGAGRYAFRNEFSRLFMNNDLRYQEAVMQAWAEANIREGGDEETDVLTSEQKRLIREQVKREFKEEPTLLNDANVSKLLEIVKRTRDQVIQGLDFKDPAQKEAYEKFKAIVDSLPLTYDRIINKREIRTNAMDSITEAFPDNWGVRESCKDYARKKFDEYVKKYVNEIAEDTLKDQIEEFGVTMDMPSEEFYPKLYKKAAELQEHRYDFLEKYVGKEISFVSDWGSKKYGKLQAGQNKGEYTFEYNTSYGKGTIYIPDALNGWKVAPEYDEGGYNFKDLVYLRFVSLYNKSIEGDWALEHLPAIQNMENLINELPDGHFKTNDEIQLITNRSYTGGNHGGYAWYSPTESRINLSAECVAKGSMWGMLAKPTEFRSVVTHEIGHAVSHKLGRDDYYDYKLFVVECGWSYEQTELFIGKTATGEQKDIPRKGSRSGIPLITKYAHKSPEEAFAEYYSFYHVNKESFDKFFQTNDPKHLQGHQKTVTDSASSEQAIGKMVPWKNEHAQEAVTWKIEKVGSEEIAHTKPALEIYKDTVQGLSARGQDHSIVLNSPWEMTVSAAERKKFSGKTLGQRKDLSIHSMPPVVAVKDGLNRVIIDGMVRQEVSRMNKKLVPTIEISKEEYIACKKLKMTDSQIAACVYVYHENDYVPMQIAPQKQVKGLIYHDELVPLETIAAGIGVIKKMKQICESEELQKALEDLFSKARGGIYENTEENRKLGRVGQKYGEELKEPERAFKDGDRVYLTKESHRDYGKQYTILGYQWSDRDNVYKYSVRAVGGHSVDYMFPQWLAKDKPDPKKAWGW